MDSINAQCTLRGRMDIESFLCSPTGTVGEKKNESSQVVSIMAPVRTSSKAHMCNPPPLSGIATQWSAVGNQMWWSSQRFAMDYQFFPSMWVQLYLSAPECVRVCSVQFSDMGPFWWLGGQEVPGESASFNSSKQIDSGLAKAPLWWHKTNNTQLPGWLQSIRLQDMLRRIEIRERIRDRQRECVWENTECCERGREGGREGGRLTDREEDVFEKGEVAEQHRERKRTWRTQGGWGKVFTREGLIRPIYARARSQNWDSSSRIPEDPSYFFSLSLANRQI